MSLNELELLLAHADDRSPVLNQGLSLDTAAKETRPPQTPGLDGQLYLADPGGDPNQLDAQRWGVVTPKDEEGKRLLQLVEPLIELRARQQGAKVLRFEAPSGLEANQAAEWVRSEYRDEKIHEEDRPHYLLLLGDLHQLSVELQQILANDALVGRLCFTTPAGKIDEARYAAYVEKVLHWEANPAPQRQARALFYAVEDGTMATDLGRRKLVQPCYEMAQERRSVDAFPAEEIVKLEDHGDPDPDLLLEQVQRPHPSVLLTLSHGLGAPKQGWASVDEQLRRQGEMSFGTNRSLGAKDLETTAFLPGGIWFYFACFGAGTPSRSVFYAWLKRLADAGQFTPSLQSVLKSLPSETDRPFIAALPQAALANPKGPLAVIGHLDLAWTYSFTEAGTSSQGRIQKFLLVLQHLCKKRRVGVGIGNLWLYYKSLNDTLLQDYDQEEEARVRNLPYVVEPDKRARLWMQRNDLRGYILLGDPAVQLPLARPV